MEDMCINMRQSELITAYLLVLIGITVIPHHQRGRMTEVAVFRDKSPIFRIIRPRNVEV